MSSESQTPATGKQAVSATLVKSLPASIQTPDNLQYCCDEMFNFVKNLTQSGRRKAAGGQPDALPLLSHASLDVLAVIPKGQRSDVKAIEKIADELTHILEHAPVVHVTLAAPAPPTLKLSLTEWFRANASGTVLVAFHVNPDIAGGMVVRTINKVYDFSFRTSLLANPQKFIEVLEHA